MGDMRRLLVTVASCLLVVLALAGCSALSSALSTSSVKAHSAKAHSTKKAHSAKKAQSGAPARTVATQVDGGSGTLRVLVEPAAGVGTIYKLITGAKSSVDLTMYELIDPTAENDLAADAKRGVDVRVILDSHLEKSRNTATYDFLSAHRVHVTWADSGTTYHQKTLTVDGETSAVMTLNMVTKDYSGTRDFAIIDTSRADVAAIIATFNADFAHRAITPPDGADLVWSPTNSEASILAVIDGAKRTLSVENEEMHNTAVTDALAAAARRGVDVRVVMTADSEWDSAFNQLAQAGVHIRLYANSDKVLYIHAKAVVADAGRSDQQMFVGSENFSTASLRYNRELGVRTANKAVIAVINATLAADYAGAKTYSASLCWWGIVGVAFCACFVGKGSDMRQIRMVPALAGAALALALAACTSTTTVVKYAGSSPTSSAGPAASSPAPARPSPSPTGPAVTITPGGGVKAADPAAGITVSAAGGTLKNVTVSTSGEPVSGTYSAGRTSWHSAWTLNVSQIYTVTAIATAANGVTTTRTSTFHTLTPANTFTTEIFEGQGETYGVGMPIILTFSHPIKNKAAVEQSIQLTTSKRVVGAWYWDGDSALDFRPRDFWPANTTVSFTGRFNGVLGAPGVYGYHTLTQSFVIGQSVIAVASTQTHRTQIYIGGKLKYNWPISTGRDTLPTPDGSYLAIEKSNPVRMIGGAKGTAGYYNELVNWAVRFTFSGDYYHSAPWSVVDQGTTNVSHGCVNLPPPAAVIYYKLAVPGDPITITGSPRPGTWDNGWTEWFLSWNQLLGGSALHEAVVAGPQGSTFVRPSTLRPNTAKAPLGTALAGNNLG